MAPSTGLRCDSVGNVETVDTDDGKALLKKRAQAKLDQLPVSEPRRKVLKWRYNVRRTQRVKSEHTAEQSRLESQSQMQQQQKPPASKRDCFAKLPAEIRNAIYELVLLAVKDNRPLGLTTRLPAIVNVSRQTLRESLTMWLGDNDFVVHVQRTNSTKYPRTDQGYRKVLDWLDWVSPPCVKFIRCLTIILEDHAEVRCDNGRRHPDWALKDIWSTFVAEVANRGLLSNQLRWPGLSEEQLSNMVRVSEEDNWLSIYEARDTARAQAEFQELVLVPSLIENNLFDESCPPINIFQQAAQRFEQTLLGYLDAAAVRQAETIYKEEKDSHSRRADGWRPCGQAACDCCLPRRCCSGRRYCVEVLKNLNRGEHEAP